MILKEFAEWIGAKNIIVKHYNNEYYKNDITVILSEHLALHVVGKTADFVPLDEIGLTQKLSTGTINAIMDRIKEELKDEII